MECGLRQVDSAKVMLINLQQQDRCLMIDILGKRNGKAHTLLSHPATLGLQDATTHQGKETVIRTGA